MTSRYMGCLKRKDFEELGVDYFHGDADVVASTKKLRLRSLWSIRLVCYWIECASNRLNSEYFRKGIGKSKLFIANATQYIVRALRGFRRLF